MSADSPVSGFAVNCNGPDVFSAKSYKDANAGGTKGSATTNPAASPARRKDSRVHRDHSRVSPPAGFFLVLLRAIEETAGQFWSHDDKLSDSTVDECKSGSFSRRYKHSVSKRIVRSARRRRPDRCERLADEATPCRRIKLPFSPLD